MQLAAIWAAGLLVLAVVVWLAYRLWKSWQAKQASAQLGDMLERQADKTAGKASNFQRDEVLWFRFAEARYDAFMSAQKL